jgi:hypothetical protein|tara:strand:+ start:992 stop:1210 length:219 start_codon:yes stop_codon:yes gene_type:complete
MPKGRAKDWIGKANLKEGAFTSQAKTHGLSVKQFETKVIKAYDNPKIKYNPTTTTYKRALLSKRFRGMRKKK